MKRLFFIGFILLGTIGLLYPQELTDIEELLESNDIRPSEEGYEEMVSGLLQLQASPLDINTADFDSLKMLFFLSDNQIDNILAFRRKYGVFLALEELLLVGGIGKKDLTNIRPFVRIGDVSVRDRVRAVKKTMSHEIVAQSKLAWPFQEGYKVYSPRNFKTEAQYRKKLDSRFRGIPLGTFVKYKMKIGKHLQGGVTLENDPGEAYFTRYQKTGFDFFSFHLYATAGGRIRTLALGDYRIQWGQGLLVWSGFTSGKSALALGNEKSARGIAPYTSTDENNYLRGMAVALKPWQDVTAELFFSYKRTDGTILEMDSLTDDDVLTAALYRSGYHRNKNECEKKNVLKELTTGASVRWNTPLLRFGVNALYYDFNPEIEIGDKVYRRYHDTGNRRFLISADYKTGWGNIYLFGETAYAARRGWATVNGLRFSGSSKVALCALYRRYDKKYVSHYAGGFGEYSNTSNEEGVYLGADLTLFPNLKINAYYDWFHFFSPRYNAFMPGYGQETSVVVSYTCSAFGHLFRYKREKKPEDRKGAVLGSVLRRKEEFRYQFTSRINRQWELRSRFDLSLYEKGGRKESGYMIYQDVVYTAASPKFKGYFRVAYFDTDSYYSRIYTYENTVLYGYSFPAYFDRGIRTYVNLNWKPFSTVTLYLKSGMTYYPDREYLGSSVTKVEDNKLFDVIVQLRVKL